MQKKFKFTNANLKALKKHDPNARSTELELSDEGAVSGLKLLVGKSGNKRFLLRYTFQSKKSSIAIGRFGDIDVATARKIAQKLHTQIAEGINPKAEKDSFKSQPTLSFFFWDTYLPVIKIKKRSWADDQQRFKQFIEPALGSVRLKEIKPIDILHLQQLIANQQQAREQRAITIGEKLANCGFLDAYQDAKKLAGEGTITRAHFAKVLYQQGHVATMQKAFDHYLGKKGRITQKAYVKPQWCSIEQAVEAIHLAGGSAVIAHPIRYDLSSKWLRRLIVHFKESQGDGLEVVLPQMNPQQRQIMLNYCLEYNLHASTGSDFHHPNKWSDLGRNLILPDGAIPVWAMWK